MTTKAIKVRQCRICGCTDDNCSQCIEKTGFPCYWIDKDLCSACYAEIEKFAVFRQEFWKWFPEHYREGSCPFEEDSEEVMKIAQRYGLVKEVIYDPAKHGELDADPGATIWYWGKENA